MKSLVKDDAAEILSDLIEENGLKKTFVAYKMGITLPKLSSVLHGRNKFTADIAFRAAEVLNVSPGIFLHNNYTKRVNQ